MTDNNQVEQPASAVAPNEKGKATKKKAAPAAKAKKVADHPKYSEMIKEALGVLKVRTDFFGVLNLPWRGFRCADNLLYFRSSCTRDFDALAAKLSGYD